MAGPGGPDRGELAAAFAGLPGALQGLQDRAVAEAVATAGGLLTEHLTDRHRVQALFVTLDGGSSAVTTGQKGNLQLPWSYDVTGWTLAADASGSIVVDLLTADYSAYPTVASICAAAKPTLSAAQKATDATLTGWTTRLTKDHFLRIVVDSASTVTVVTLTLHLRPV